MEIHSPAAIPGTENGEDSRASSVKTPRVRRARWHNDGPDDSVSSLSVLLDWISTEGNYSKWRGGDKQSGETKAMLAAQISAQIRSMGIVSVRKPKDIITKIGLLEQSYRDAADFLTNTGSGITNEATLQEAIEKRCPHYSILKDVLGDRPSARPLVTSDDLDFFSQGDFEPDLEHDDTAPILEASQTPESSSKRRKIDNGVAKQSRTIRPRSPSVSSTISEWSDLNTAITRSKAQERKSQREMHEERMQFKREQFEETTRLEARRIASAEEEARCRVMLLQAQAKKEAAETRTEDEAKCRVLVLKAQVQKEQAQAQREMMMVKVELARNRKRLREEGIPDVTGLHSL